MLRLITSSLSISFVAAALQGPTLSRKLELPPVRLSYDALSSLIATIDSFVTRAVSRDSIEPYFRSRSITLSDGVHTFTQARDFTSSGLAGAPNVSLEADYTHRTGGRTLAEVSFSLRDFSRQFTVTGEAPDQVDALTQLLDKRFRQFTVWYGGWGFRFAAGIIVILAIPGIAILVIELWGRGKRPGLGLQILIGASGPIVVFLLPWSRWLPGTAIVSEEANVLARYSAEISFAGVIFSIVSFLFMLWLTLRRPRMLNSQPPSAT